MRPLDMFFATLVAAIWGGNYVSAKFAMAHFPPFFLTSLRFACVGALLLPFVPRPEPEQIRRIAALALVLGVLHFALLFSSMYIGLSIASLSIVADLGVPFSCLLGALLHNDRLGKWRILGMVVAFVGIIIVSGTPNIVQHPLAFCVGLAGSFFWGLSNIMIKDIKGVKNFQMLAWMAVFAVPQLWIISAVLERHQWQLLAATPPFVMAAVAYTVLGSTLTAYGLWYHLLQQYKVTQVAPFSLLTPVFGIAFGRLFFPEPLTWQVVIGGAITIFGVAVILMRRPGLVGKISEAA